MARFLNFEDDFIPCSLWSICTAETERQVQLLSPLPFDELSPSIMKTFFEDEFNTSSPHSSFIEESGTPPPATSPTFSHTRELETLSTVEWGSPMDLTVASSIGAVIDTSIPSVTISTTSPILTCSTSSAAPSTLVVDLTTTSAPTCSISSAAPSILVVDLATTPAPQYLL
ncbi:mucin-5AC-like [Copidosoma floridanum]|uniref:mucin-5AC-like n=1 Tax=Copidosoma floridanum TaxID=29053 RepID=UPI0006C96AF7|nr:mucin-5AC-like [Copidosoma floridanum]